MYVVKKGCERFKLSENGIKMVKNKRKWALTLENGQWVSKTVRTSLKARRTGPKQLKTRQKVAKRE